MFFRRAFLTLLIVCCFQPFYAAAADGVSFFGAWPCGNNGTSSCVLNTSLQIPTGTVYQISTDTGWSRDSAGVADFGNGTAGNKSGTVQASIFNAGTGFQIAGAAATAGHVLRANGTNYVDSAILTADLPLPYLVGTMYNTSQYTNATTSNTTISTSPTISAGWVIQVDCTGAVSVTGTAEKYAFAITPSQTPQSEEVGGFLNYTTAGQDGSVVATASPWTIQTNAVVASTAAAYQFEVHSIIQWNATTPGTFTFQAQSGSAAGTVTINAYQSNCLITRLL